MDVFRNLCYLMGFLYGLTILYIFVRTKKNLHIFQQNLYNENNRYIKWGIKKFSNMFRIMDIIILIVNIANLFIKNRYLMLVDVIYIILFFKEYYAIKHEQVKIPLKVTSRVKRLIFTISILYLLPILGYIFGSEYVASAILSSAIVFNFFIMFIANVFNKPAEKMVFNYYKNKAIKKLRSSNHLDVIGITGSYGKTSSKNILNDILSVKYNSLASPKNFNTQYGLMITINNYLDKFHEIFIAEMGAYKCGRIQLLCDLVKPKYGIITKIGEAHLETFGSKENVQKGKFELIENLPSDGLAILNKDDEWQVNYKMKNNVRVIWIGIESKDADLVASNIEATSSGMSFDVYFKDTGEKERFTTKLLGTANVYNILAALAFARFKGMTLNELKMGVKKINTIEHRLELKKYTNDITIIDDAYNSNPVGSKMALDVLKLMDGVRIVVTPGMVELGELQYELNKKYGEYISEVADYTILVGHKQTEPIQEGLKEKKYASDKLFIIDDFKECFKIIEGIKSKNKHHYVLLENDLPDIFNE